ncbi:MAG: LamG-like jellyroll fold domain-containing protein [Gammaproteobacteria bacterium]
MHERIRESRPLQGWPVWVALALGLIFAAITVAAPPDPRTNVGPYNVTFLEGGTGLTRPLAPDMSLLRGRAQWSLSGWIYPSRERAETIVVAAIGDSTAATCRCLQLRNGKLALRLGGSTELAGNFAIAAKEWTAIAATYDGNLARLYVNGSEVASATAETNAVTPAMNLAPHIRDPLAHEHFGGSLAEFQLYDKALAPGEVHALATTKPAFDLIVFDNVGSGWPWQQRAWRGLQEPQDAWTLPKAKTPADKPIAIPPLSSRALEKDDLEEVWTLSNWRMREEPRLADDGAHISQPGYRDDDWYAATVPGTVLTTLIDRGVYPDPDHALNNMFIPESLARQSYWYRTQFTPSVETAGKELTLTFKGINYSAEVWINGAKIGSTKGAFIRGVFDVTDALKPGKPNVLAVRVSPPPHPGIPHEESIAAGPGENGGNMAIDGPTFVAAEGWDWIPGIRDRNTGLWQAVELRASGLLRVLDPNVITTLPLPRTDPADVAILIPLENKHETQADATITASFEGVQITKNVSLPPGRSEVRLDAREFPQLRIRNPRLWWPNGYGPQNLYTLTIAVSDSAAPSDTRRLRFGIRHITYELSLFDHEGRLRRVEVDLAGGTARGERLVDVRHEAIKRTSNGWAASLTPAGETSPAVHPVASESMSPFLTLRVNGTPIAARGGNWGMDDSRKRVSRERLEPYFRLHKAANLNIIRNWMGQNTEDVFYDLADEYGLLILNDFWESTQDFQVEAQDPALFLANARDVISRYRYHPSIALWFGRNEGVPQPILNEGLADLVAQLDGTRHFNGSSNMVNLGGSGPYNYRAPESYFTTHAQGFSVEVGTPSLATLESIKATVPEADRWPLSDTLAYHDWHFGGNGDVATFMKALAAQFGEATSLEDFERKAQMMNYVTYRAVFEGFNAQLWTRNSGRLLWMTHPAWPSNHWQIYSSDYDTHAAYYGAKKACEPVHAQLDLPDFRLAVVNTTREKLTGLSLRTRIIALNGHLLEQRTDRLDAAANIVTALAPLALARHLDKDGLVLVALSLTDAHGKVVSENVYWQAKDEASHQRLNALKAQPVSISAKASSSPDERVVRVTLVNRGTEPALNTKLTLVDARGQRILPAYYSDNYLALLPGEPRTVEVRFPASFSGESSIQLRGWNVRPVAASTAP